MGWRSGWRALRERVTASRRLQRSEFARGGCGMTAVVMAGAAGAVGVLAAWDVLVVIERDGARLVGPLLASVTRAGSGGAVASGAERRRLVALLAAALLAAGWLVVGPLPAVALAAGAPVAGRAVVRARR